MIILTFSYTASYCQDTLKAQRIDSIILSREKSLIHEYRALLFNEKDTNLKKRGNLTRIYKYAAGDILYARLDVWINGKDTDQINFFYFDQNTLIKAGTTLPQTLASSFYDRAAYFENGNVVHWYSSDQQPFPTDYYTFKSKEFLKKIKRRPVRFTL